MKTFKQYMLTEERQMGKDGKAPFTWGGDIGMWQINRPPNTCKKYATRTCLTGCYTNKQYSRLGHTIIPKVAEMEAYFKTMEADKFKEDLLAMQPPGSKSKLAKFDRFRFCSSGEPFNTSGSINRIVNVARANPEIKFWAPTRAWRPPRKAKDFGDLLIDIIDNAEKEKQSVGHFKKKWAPDIERAKSKQKVSEEFIMEVVGYHSYEEYLTEAVTINSAINSARNIPNLFIQASTDTETSMEEWNLLDKGGWSTLFFGKDDIADKGTPNGQPFYKCPKTHMHDLGFCYKCTMGCFNRGQVHVHLKQH